MKKIIIALSAVYLTTGCGLIKNMEEMHDKTMELSTDTKTIVETSKEIKNFNQSIYRDARQDGAYNRTREFFDSLRAEPSLDRKFTMAGRYYGAFEFQLFKTGIDTEERREFHYFEAMQIFLRDIRSLGIREHGYDVSPSSDSNDLKTLQALAAALFKVNPNQEFYSKKEGYEKVSFLDLIERTLSLKAGTDTGEIDHTQLPEYQQEILYEWKNVVYMLQLRANVLAAKVMIEIKPEIADSIWTKGLTYLFDWNANLQDDSGVQLAKWSTGLEMSNDTRDYLKGIGVDPRIDSKLLKVYRNMDLGELSSKATPDVDRFRAALEKFRN
jgi:hypothetical protein